MYTGSLGETLDPSKPIISIIFHPFWVCEALGNIWTFIVANSHFGKRPVAGDMTMCGSHFLPYVNEYVLSYWWNFITGPQAISRADLGFFIIAMWVRNPNLCVPVLITQFNPLCLFFPKLRNDAISHSSNTNTKNSGGKCICHQHHWINPSEL